MTSQETTQESLPHKTGKETRRAIEEKYRLITENMTDVVWQTTPDLVITFISSSIKKLVGYETQEIVGKPVTYLLTPGSQKLVHERYPEIMRKLAELKEIDREIFVVEHIRKDGTTIWTEVVTNPTFDSAGQFLGFQGVTRDISERKRAEDALRESERFLCQSEKIARTGGWRANPFTGSLHWSQGVYDIIEVRNDYQPNLDEGLEFYTPLYRPILKDAMTRTIERGEPFEIEAEVVTTSGKRLWTEVRGLMRVEEGEEPQVVGSFQDITERKLAEEALRISERKYRLLFDIAPIGIMLVDTEGNILEVNHSILETLGSPSPEATKSINVLSFPLLVEVGISDLFRTCMMENRPIDTEVFYTSKWGKDTCLRIILTPKLNNKGNVAGCLAVIEDVMPRKLAEKAQKESEEKFSKAFFLSPDTVVITRLSDGTIISVNEGLEQSLGFSENEAIGKTALDLGLWANLDERDRFLTKLKAEGKVNNFEASFRSKNGNTEYGLISSSIIRLDGEEHSLSVVRNVTEYKLAEEALKISERKYRLLFDMAPIGIVFVDTEGNILEVNRSILETLFPPGFESTKSVNVLTARRLVAAGISDLFKTCMIETRPIDTELFYKSKRGKDTCLRIILTPKLNEQGNVAGCLAVMEDVTPRKIAEKELKTARAELEFRVEERTNKLMTANEKLEMEIAVRERAERELQMSNRKLELALAVASQLRVQAEVASAAKTEFLTNMSHELRTPLTAVIGFSDLLGDQLFGKLNEKQSGYVTEISAAGRHLLRLINDILDLAKVESGKMDIRMSPVDLSELLGHCLIMIRETAMKRGLTVNLKVSEQLFEEKIQADDVRLKQIVMNLLSNAAKFTPSGGTIRLEAEHREKEILVSVSDTGVGLKPEDQKRIFQAFESLDSSFSRQEQGTGLGLALVRKLVELHGGRVWVESGGEGMGSEFKFVFPFVQAEKDMDAPLRTELASFPSLTVPDLSCEAKNGAKVLVVEDNESNMKFTTDLLKAVGYEAIHAFSAEEAIKKAETENPALILMDISLPGMDGLTATKALKSNPATAHIPVVVLTAHAMKDIEERAMEAGCEAFILKPIDTGLFYRALSGIIKPADSE